MGPKLDKLIPILQITFDPYHSSILNTIVLQYLTQYFMINSMKHLKKIWEDAKCCFISVDSWRYINIKSIKANADYRSQIILSLQLDFW